MWQNGGILYASGKKRFLLRKENDHLTYWILKDCSLYVIWYIEYRPFFPLSHIDCFALFLIWLWWSSKLMKVNSTSSPRCNGLLDFPKSSHLSKHHNRCENSYYWNSSCFLFIIIICLSMLLIYAISIHRTNSEESSSRLWTTGHFYMEEINDHDHLTY
jgi:hypothetical protein